MKKLILIVLSFIFIQCQGQKNPGSETVKEKELRQEALIEKYVHNCAKKFNYNFQMQEWQESRSIVLSLIFGSKKQCLILRLENMK